MPGKGIEKEQPEAQTKRPRGPPVLNAGYTTGNKIDMHGVYRQVDMGGMIKQESHNIELQTGINVVKEKRIRVDCGAGQCSLRSDCCRAAHSHWDANEGPLSQGKYPRHPGSGMISQTSGPEGTSAQ